MKSSGFVYVLNNFHMPDIVKIGSTKNSPESRAAQLSGSTGVPSDFYVVAHLRCDDCRLVEKMLHATFAGKRVNANREFFAVGIWDVIDELMKYPGEIMHPRSHVAEVL